MCTHKDSKEFDKHIIVFFHQHSDSKRVISFILVEGKRRFGRPTNKSTTDEQYLEIMSLRNGKNLTKTWPKKFIWAFSWSIYYLPEASSQMFFVEEQLSKSILRRGNNKGNLRYAKWIEFVAVPGRSPCSRRHMYKPVISLCSLTWSHFFRVLFILIKYQMFMDAWCTIGSQCHPFHQTLRLCKVKLFAPSKGI